MEYLFSFLLLLFNLIHYENPMGSVLFFGGSAVLVAALFYVVFRKTKSYLGTCVILMCYTWQLSWINIFGGATSELQLPWFYVLGVMILGYGVFNIKKCLSRRYSAFSFLVFVIFLIEFNVPLLMSKSISEGLKEYILIAFFVVLVFVAYLYSDSVSHKVYDHFKKAFIWAVFITAVFLIFQHTMFVNAGVRMFKLEYMPSFSGEYQVSCYLLMEDHSCSTVMLGCAVFYILEMLKKKNWYYLMPALAIITISMAMTSRRTSTISLLIALALYVFLHYKGLGKKSLYIFGFTLVGMAFIYYMTIMRPVDSIGQLLDSNGRIETYMKTLEVVLNNPLGVGFDNAHLAALVGGIVPHNTLLRWLAMGGYPFAASMCLVVLFAFIKAKRKKMTAEFWVIIYSLLASSFIPDIINGRFFVIPCMMVFLYSVPPKEEGSLLK